jgi:dihydropteroate synthase
MIGSPALFKAGHYQLKLGQKTYIVGILNVTPDSFSDGGRFVNLDDALRQAERLIAEGADILDIGGESTRPGSQKVSVTEEINRIRPVIAQLASRFSVPVSVDTFKSDVAEAALSAGATIVNDVTGLMGDHRMAEVVARMKAGVILMHNAILPETMAEPLRQLELLAATRAFLALGCQRALEAGVTVEQIILDPGVGFGLLTDESIALMAELEQIQCLPGVQLPLLVGPSRKRFIGELLDRPLADRSVGTAAAVAASIARGADFVRVHDVDTVAQTTRLCDAILRRPGTRP